MTTINFPTVNDIKVYIEAEYQGTAQPWGDKVDHSHFSVTISTEDSGVAYTTDYYAQRGLTCIEGEDAACVLQCVLLDAVSYDSCDGDIDEFAREFGYDASCGIKRVLAAFEGCKKAHEVMMAMGLFQYGGELSEAIDNEDYTTDED